MSALWGQIEELVAKGQQVYRALKYAPFPTVGAPSGLALGGGCEILLHCGHPGHAETYMGLVETGSASCRPGAAARRCCCATWPTGGARVADAADQQGVRADQPRHRREVGGRCEAALYLRPDDGITMNRDRLLADAKARALRWPKGTGP